MDSAEDWTGLQVMDGNTLKPAMGQGFKGQPTSEQMENLYKMRENPYIKAVCEDLTLDKLRQFVLNDGAKALADKIIGVAKDYNPEAKGNELQKQQEVPKAMM